MCMSVGSSSGTWETYQKEYYENENYSPPHSSYQVPISPQLGPGPCELLSVHDGILATLIMYRLCAGTLCTYAVHIRRAHMLWSYERNTHAVNRRHHVIAVLPILWLSFLLPPFSDVPWAWWVDIDALFMVWHWLPLMANILISHGSLHWPWSRARRPFSDHGQEQARWIGISIHIQPADQHLTSHVVKIIKPMKSESIEFLIYGYFPRRVELSPSVS